MGILIVLESEKGQLKSNSGELLSYGKALGNFMATDVFALSINCSAQSSVEKYGVSKAIEVHSEHLQSFNAKNYADCVAEVSRKLNCDIIVVSSSTNAKYMSGILAQKLQASYTNNIVDLPIEKSPFIPLRMFRVAHEAYGRSYCEELLGDLKSLEYLSKAIVEGSAAAAKIIFLCNPNGTTRPDALARAANGSIVAGNPNDVAPLQMQKQADLTVALNTIARIEQRLSFAFLLNSAIQAGASGRDRVTAEEIRMVAQELEAGLGGIYSVLSVELQLPLVNRKMAMMERQGRLPRLPKDVVKPQITTGLDALGRGNDKAKLIEFLQTLAGTMGPEAMARFVNSRELITRLAAADGLDTFKLIKSEEELMAEEEQQAMMMQQQMAAQDPNNDPAKQAALVKAENDSIRAEQEAATGG